MAFERMNNPITPLGIPLILEAPQGILRADVPLPHPPVLPLQIDFTPREGTVFFAIKRDPAAQARQRDHEERIFNGLQVKYGGTHGNTVAVGYPDEYFLYALDATRKLIKNDKVQVILRPAFFQHDLSQKTPDIGIGARAAALIRQHDGTFLLTDFKADTDLFEITEHVDPAGNNFRRKRLKRAFDYELGLKVAIAESEGLVISNAGIAHFSAEMVHDGSGDPAHYTTYTDLTHEVRAAQRKALTYIRRIQEAYLEALTQVAVTPVETKTPIARLYKYGGTVRAKLAELGISYIEDIDPDSPFLDPIQRRQIRALKKKDVEIDDPEGLKRDLQGILDRLAAVQGGRLPYFDGEGITPKTAILAGTKNGQPVGLQFSCHWRDAGGTLTHEQLIYDDDPREPQAGEKLDRKIAVAILKAVGPAGPIIVYSAPHERMRFRQLAGRLREHGDIHLAEQLDEITGDKPLRDLAARLEAEGKKEYARQLGEKIGKDKLIREYIDDVLRTRAEQAKGRPKGVEATTVADAIEEALGQTRLVDLLELIRNHVYHPAQEEGFTLKSVLRAFYPTRSHDELVIKNAREAVWAWEERLRADTTPERKAQLRLQLLSYCAHDTMAEDILLQKLFELVNLPWPFVQNV